MSYFRPDIDAMEGYVPGEQPQTGKFIKLNTNENPYPPSPAVHRAIETLLQGQLARYPDPEASAFRHTAAERLGFDADWILCGNGGDEILTIVTRAFVPQGAAVRYAYPSYTLYQTLAQIQGAATDAVPFQEDWSLSDSFVRPTNALSLVYLANPNSPSGTLLPTTSVRKIARRLPCPLLIDEAYVDFAENDCLELVRENENVMVLRSMSKSYALAGVRFGFLVAQPHIISGLLKIKDSYNCDALSIAAATAAMADVQWQVDNRDKIVATRQRLVQQLLEFGFDTTPSSANFVWCRHQSTPAKTIYQQLKQQQILVRYMEFQDWGDGLRITVGTDAQIDAFLSRLDTIV